MPDSDRLYLGTNDGLRVLRRADGGWSLETQALDNAPVTALQAVPNGSGDLFAAVGAWGMWRISPDGKTIREINDGISNRELHALAVACDGSALYAGAAPPEIFASVDDGETWNSVSSFLRIPAAEKWFYPVPPYYANIRQIAAHPTRPETFYAGVEVGGLYRTRDGGATWEDLTRDMDPDCHAIALHPDRPDRILVSTPSGPYVSRDEGASWESCWKAAKPSYSASIAVSPGDPDRAIAGISKGFRGVDASIWITEDGARTWREAEGDLGALTPSQIRGALTYSRSAPTTAYAGSLAGDLFESRDGGATWSLAAGGLPPIRAILAL
jgi:photosystem II stability/assembly factor-like uncharacterized protein